MNTPTPTPASKYDISRIYRQPLAPKRPTSNVVVKKSVEKKETPQIKRVSSLVEEQNSPQKKLLDTLSEKQKQDRIKKARDAGVASVLGNSNELPVGGHYAEYHRQLDLFKERQIENAKKLNNFGIKQALSNNKPSNPIVNEYLQRKAEAARNKNRDQLRPPLPIKKNVQKEMLETLNKIRLQNLNRKVEPAAKKIDVFKAQSEEQFKQLQVDQQKALEREKKQWEEHVS